jgi:gluconate kinase
VAEGGEYLYLTGHGRMMKHRRDHRRGDVTDEVMREHLASFEPPGKDESHLTVDSAGYQNEVVLSTVRAVLSH